MPIYEYEPMEESTCEQCCGTFEMVQKVNDPPLTICPKCQKPVRRVISGFGIPKWLAPLSVTKAKDAGFKLLKRRDKGVYERL